VKKYISSTQTADSTPYDNSTSGLNAETTRDAIDELSGTISNTFAVTGEPTGFVNTTDSSISFNNATRTFTISPVSGSYDVYIKGKKVTVSSTLTLTIPDIAQNHFVAIDENGALVNFTVFTNLLFKDYAYVATFYWSTTLQEIVGLGEERHGLTMDWATHSYLHNHVGARIRPDSFQVGNFTITGTGNSDADVQASFNGGILTDEDISMTITDSATPTLPFQQTLSTIAKLPIMYKNGTNGEWLVDTATDYLAKFGTSTIQYNLFNGTTWSQPDAGNSTFVAMWVFVTHYHDEPIRLIMGQNTSSTIDQAKIANTYELLNLSGLPAQEYKVLYRLIFETKTSYSNAIKARLVEVLDLRKTIDQGQVVVSVSDHGNLTGLGDDDHLQYLRTDGTRALIGDMDFGGFDATNIGLVDGVDVSAHSSRHLPSGADPLTTGTPSSIGTANTEGSANAFARQDHIHNHGNQTTPTHHAVATTSANGFMSSTDKTKLDGISGTRIFKSGNVAAGSFSGGIFTPYTATVTFSTAMPNTNYAITINGIDARTWRYQSKTVNGFVINSGSTTAPSNEVSWIAINNGETVE
jgi:hypothetical protein